MPAATEELEVPVSTTVRSSFYMSGEYDNKFVNYPDQAEALAREFFESVKPIKFDHIPTLEELKGSRIGAFGLNAVPFSVAQVITLNETQGKATIEYDEGRGRFTLKPTRNLDARAFEVNGGSDIAYSYENLFNPFTDEVGLLIGDLTVMIANYKNYAERHRIRLIRNIVRGYAYRPYEDRREKKPVRSGQGDFGEFFENFHDSLDPNKGGFEDMTLLDHGTLSSRRWGIEIEAVDIEGIDTPENWELKDDGSLREERISEMDEHDYDCASNQEPECEDGSGDHAGCTNDCDCGYNEYEEGELTTTGEWNSPILRSYHSRGIKHITDELKYRQSNYSAGVHVHVEASDLTPEQVGHVGLLYSLFEPLFEEEYWREERSYCESLGSERVINRIRRLRQFAIEQPHASVTDLEWDSRYYTVNLASLPQHGTIEFRAMGPRYEYDTLVKWASFVREMVNMGKAMVPQREFIKVKNFKDLLVLMSKYGKETVTPEWAPDQPARNLTEELGSENRRQPNLSVKGDYFEDYTAATPFVYSTGVNYDY